MDNIKDLMHYVPECNTLTLLLQEILQWPVYEKPMNAEEIPHVLIILMLC